MNPTALPEVAPDNVAALWAELDRQRLDWAFRAYDSFVASLSMEVRAHLAHKERHDEAYVVVFGKTQVGKTTLLMDLMGIAPSSLGRVSLVLRGGRAPGESATATAMEYRRSPDQRWGLRIAGGDIFNWFDDDFGITSALSQLRATMEDRQLVVNAPCIVYIPADCFAIQGGELPVRMLDLPGDAPANLTEHEHVQEMARKYVPLADLVLLVGKGDDLSFLQPGRLTLPGIEDWQSVPSRFRIVTTYSFTAQSVQNLVRQYDGPAEAGFYRQYLIEQIETFGKLSDDARRPERYFPLEFGTSWLEAQQLQPEMYERVSPMITALKRQLHADIQASTTPMARLRNAVDARVVIARVKDSQLKSMESTTRTVKQQLEKGRNEQSQAQEAARRSKKVYEHLTERAAQLSDERLRRDIDQHFHLSGSTPCGDPGKSVAGFKILVQQAKASLTQRLANSRVEGTALKETAWFWRGMKIEIESRQVEDTLNKAFSSFLDSLDKLLYRWYDKYWKTGSGSNYQRDCNKLRNCIDEASKALTELGRKVWLSAALQRLSLHRAEERAALLEQRSWEQMADDLAHPIARLEQELAVHENADLVFRERMEKDLQESRRFIDLLDTEYLAELQKRRKAILSEAKPVPAFLRLLASVHLGQIRKQLLLHIEPA